MLSQHRLSAAALSTLEVTGPITAAGAISLNGIATALLTQPAITGQIALSGSSSAILDGGNVGGSDINLVGVASVWLAGTSLQRELFRNFRSQLVYTAEINIWATSDREAA